MDQLLIKNVGEDRKKKETQKKRKKFQPLSESLKRFTIIIIIKKKFTVKIIENFPSPFFLYGGVLKMEKS